MLREPINRVDGFGRLDRDRAVSFLYDNMVLKGYKGDSVASVLLSYDKKVVGRSFKYHRPRGILGFGSEEPSALVSYGSGANLTPNTRTTMLEIQEGMEVCTQNAWPSVDFDFGELTSLFGRFLPAGFYYKTFIYGWKFYEPLIRRMAGLGKATSEICERSYQWKHHHCDVLIIGGGISGLSALEELMDKNLRIVIIDEHANPGGWLLGDDIQIEGVEGAKWAAEVVQRAQSYDKIQCLPRTTALGLYQQNLVVALERREGLEKSDLSPREVLWKIRAKEVILASGAIEQPSVFVGNDCPGVMMAGATRRYLYNYGVRVGGRVGLVTNNDDAYQTALAMSAAGSEVQVIDSRQAPRGLFADRARDAGIEILESRSIWQVQGRRKVKGAVLQRLQDGGTNIEKTPETLDVDSIAMSHGYVPAIHLYGHQGGKLVFDEDRQIFVPKASKINGLQIIGMARGLEGVWASFEDGKIAAKEVLARLKVKKSKQQLGTAEITTAGEKLSKNKDTAGLYEKLWFSNLSHRPEKQFIDFQNDVTARDVMLAHQEGFRSVEHLKRYTTLGMATDQGKSSNMQGLVLMSKLRMEAVQAVGTTKYRPPYTPATIGAFSGMNRYDQFDVARTTAVHKQQVAAHAVFEDVGNWKRARYYPKDGETMFDAVQREAKQTREFVGMIDASTLGKIDIRGKDSVKLLDMVYSNAWGSLAIGNCRYGIMLNEQGMVIDDGVTARLGEHHYHMTTTTGGAGKILDWLELWLQTEWPDLDVYCTSVTEEWSVFSLSGPNSREVLAGFVDIDLSDEAFPLMSVKSCLFEGIAARIFRVSFTGEELAFELNVPSGYGSSVWQALCSAGEASNMVLYGTETMHLLRAEAGFVIVGQDTDGTVTPYDAGYGWLVSKKKEDFLGKKGLMFDGMKDAGRRELVGLLSDDADLVLEEGGAIVETGNDGALVQLGHVTSSYRSPTLGRSIAMGLVKGGFSRRGDRVRVGKRTEDGAQTFDWAKIASKDWLKDYKL